MKKKIKAETMGAA